MVINNQISTWLMEDWLPMGHKGQLVAPEGSFKTIFLSYLAACVASGNPILGQTVHQGLVLMIDEETPIASLQNHLDRFCQGLGYTGHKDIPIGIHSMKGFRFGRKTELDRLVNDLKHLQPALITFDSFIAMLPTGRQGFAENDSSTGEIIRDDLNKIIQAVPGCSTLLTTHSKKVVAEYSVGDLRLADMQSMVRGHGSIVGEGCDTGFAIKKLSEYPDPTRFAVVTKARRQAIPMSHRVVYVEMEEEGYGGGWARLKEISQDAIPPSKHARELYELFAVEGSQSSRKLVSTCALRTKSEISIALQELLNCKVIIQTGQPQTYVLNPERESECNEDYLSALENPGKGSF